MIHILIGLKFTGTDSHKCNSVAVSLIHICLNLKDKRRKRRGNRIDVALVGVAWQRWCCHLQKVIQKGFYTEGGQCGTEKYRRKFAILNLLKIQRIAGTV